MIVRPGRPAQTDARGCKCGSLIVATGPDPRELEGIVAAWQRLHPPGRTFNGAWHDRATVDEAKRIRKGRGLEADRSRLEFPK